MEVVRGVRIPVCALLAVVTANRCLATTITGTLKPNADVGVAFNDTPQGVFDVFVSLQRPNDWYIVTNDQSSVAVDKSGATIWNRIQASDDLHRWEGIGSAGDCWSGVRFHGLLKRPGTGGGPGSPPPFDASVADIDIHVDSQGLCSGDHWPPDGSYEEDVAEDTESGGLYLPRSIITGELPTPLPLPTNLTYKALTLTLRPKWVGPPNPSSVGTVTFYVSAPGLALYRLPDGTQVNQSNPLPVPPQGLSETYAILTNENFTSPGGIYASFEWYSSLRGGEDTAMDYVRLAPAWSNIFVDTNNDGSIDTSLSEGHEHSYAIYAPGVIVCKDRAGDGAGLDHLVPMTLSVSPYLTTGTLTLQAISGGNYVQVWQDSAKSGTPVTFGYGKTWDLASESVPSTLWIDGLGVGQAWLGISYKNAKGNVVCDSQVAVYVTDTISYCPSGNFAYAWEPCRWPSGTPGQCTPEDVDALLNKISDHGWDVTTSRYSDTTADDDDVEGCTLAHFKSLKYGGVLAVDTHGSTAGGIVAVCVTDEGPANAWIQGESNMLAMRSYWGYIVYVYPGWLSANWKATRDDAKAITVFLCCYGAYGGATNSPVANAGGRAMFGYTGLSDCPTAAGDVALLFGRMNGSSGGGNMRTAGQAYDGGSGYSTGFTMYGNIWTTLNPAPTDAFPHVSDNRKGAGCIIFDTYMYDGMSPSNAVMVTSGSVSSRRWFGNGSGSYGVSFDYDKTGGGTQQLHAEADNCYDQSNSRKMDGDRHTYASDKDWSF